jgi:creatinine amidohydrolase
MFRQEIFMLSLMTASVFLVGRDFVNATESCRTAATLLLPTTSNLSSSTNHKGNPQMPRTPWIQELRWPEIEAYLENDDVALIPIGATEQHGRHLPLLVDSGWAMAACERAAAISGCLVAPPIQLGWSPHHMGYPGTITLSADTLRRVAYDVSASLIYHGFHHIILVNGNRIANLPPMEIAAVQLQNTTGARVAVADAGLIARTQVKALCDAPDGGLEHAGEAESSFALHWSNENVDMLEFRQSLPNTQPSTAFDYPVELDPELNGNAVSRFVTPAQHRLATQPGGHVGDASTASAEKGEAMVEAIASELAAFISEFRTLEVGAVQVDVPT